MIQPSHPKSKADILIIDDKPENLRLLNQILNAEYKVRLAPSGKKGLDAALSNSPDLILLDVMMPELNGYEVASTLKSEEQTRDIPIIFISALGEVEDKVRGFAIGGVDFITKPFQEEEVMARVKTHLSIRALNQQLQDELTERKRVEAVHEARTRIIQFSITHNVNEILQKVLDECEELTSSFIGFFHFLLPDQVTIALQTWSTKTLDMFCHAKGDGLHYNLDQAGVWAASVREHHAIIGNNYETMLNRKGMPEGHAVVKRFVSIPILRGDKIVAIIGVGNKESDYSDRDVEIVTQLADLTWDIAERKMREEEVTKERQNFLKIFSVAPVGLILLNDQSEVFKANQAAAEMILSDPMEMIGKRAGGALMCINSQENPRGCGFGKECKNCVLRKGIEQALASGISEYGTEIEFTLLIDDIPQQRWLRLSTEPLELEGEKYVVVALDDITKNKKADEALEASEARIKTISNNFMDGMIYQVIIKPDGTRTFTYLSESVRQLHGVSAEDGISDSKLIYNNVHEDDIENLFQIEDEAIKNLSTFRAEVRMKEPSGRIRWSSLVSTPRKLEDGSVIWDGFEFDITERKEQEQQILAHQDELKKLLKESDRSRQALLSVLEDQKIAEDEIRKLNASLEERVAERTTQLEAAIKDLESFSYSVSHDLRAPLRAIDGFSHILKDQYANQLSDDGREVLERVRSNAKRMGELIDDLLKFSRLGRQPLVRQEVDTAQVVQNVMEMLQDEWINQQVEFTITPLPACKGDPSLLTQVWVNLLSNALKYSKKRANAQIEVGCQKGENGEKVYYVKDNGVGFDMRYANKLFNVFQRLHSESDFEGTGVGLALVHRIVTRHGGRIWANAEPGKGATFYFSLNE